MGFGWDWGFYWMSSSGSLSWSQSHMISLGSAGCRSVAWSEAYLFICLYDKFLFDLFVNMLESSVFGGLPKWSTNGFILVVALGISLIDFIILATIVARSENDQKGSCSITAILPFNVWINLSTIPVALWSPARASISLIFLFLQKSSNFLALKAWARSHLKERGMPWNWQYSSK